jgi:nitrate reductase gamma subunit
MNVCGDAIRTSYFRLYTSYFILHTSYHHALHGGDAVRRSVLRLDCVSTISYFVSPCVAWWSRSTTQRAAARLRLYNFILHTSYYHALHGGAAVRRSVLQLDCVSTISYFILRITMRCMVETQYDAACCGSTASLQFHTSYFVLPCVAWWRRSTTQRAAARLRLYNFILHTSYHHALHGGDAVRRSVLRLDCVSTISYFISPCVAWWRRSTTQRAAARLRLYNFILHTSLRVYGSGWPVPGRRSWFGRRQPSGSSGQQFWFLQHSFG